MNQNPLILLLLLTTMLLVGCSDDRAVAISREAADRQAAQNVEMSQHNREVAAAHHQLADVQEDVQPKSLASPLLTHTPLEEPALESHLDDRP